VDKNLEYIAEGLRDINVSGDFVSTLESCENNSSCQERIIKDVDEQTEINKGRGKNLLAENQIVPGEGYWEE